jgi:tRNA ligase
MEGFIHRFEALNPYANPDDGFDNVIDLDPTLDSRENLETVVGQLHNLYPNLITDMPSSDDLDEAINVALSEYKPDLRHEVGGRGPKPKNSQKQQQHQVSYPYDKKIHADLSCSRRNPK